jgi:hypothetical protein
VQTLKDIKNAVEIFLVKTNAVVCHDNLTQLWAQGVAGQSVGLIAQALRPHSDHGCLLLTAEFQGIADEVLEQLPHLRWIGSNRGQIAHLHAAVCLFEAYL